MSGFLSILYMKKLETDVNGTMKCLMIFGNYATSIFFLRIIVQESPFLQVWEYVK